jgi:hypothetical protein
MTFPDDLNDWDQNIFKKAAEEIATNQKAKAATAVHVPEEKKPDREFKINQDDMTNLEIAFRTANSLEDFLNMV